MAASANIEPKSDRGANIEPPTRPTLLHAALAIVVTKRSTRGGKDGPQANKRDRVATSKNIRSEDNLSNHATKARPTKAHKRWPRPRTNSRRPAYSRAIVPRDRTARIEAKQPYLRFRRRTL